jgi:hypothetical protein
MFRTVLLLVVLAISQTGCALMEPVQTFSRGIGKTLKPRGTDYSSPGDDVDSQWDFVGVEARGDRPIEIDNDPFRNGLMSPRARAIERNLGIGGP